MRTILAAQRADRPEGFTPPSQQPKGPANCPFCEGREERTPPEVWALRPDGGDPDTPGWKVRSVPKLSPALGEGGEPTEGSDPGAFTAGADPLATSKRVGEADMFSSRPATGAHEVIVHTPQHVTSLAELDESQFALAI